jgi:hypothetical protein
MTLNITLAARWLMAQSSDFRLTYKKNDGTTGFKSHTAQKQFVLHYPEWSGLLCYTGIANYNQHDTVTWLQQVLVHPPDEQRPTLGRWHVGRLFLLAPIEGEGRVLAVYDPHDQNVVLRKA